MIRELLKTINYECSKCAAVCDKAFQQKQNAYGELDGDTLYIDIRDSTGKRDPGGIIPALHLLEYYHSLNNKPKRVFLTRFEGDLTNSDVKKEDGYHVTDISEEAPENQTYIIIKNGVSAEDLLNTYNSMLTNASKRNIQIKFPRDVLIKTASSEEINELKRAIGYYSNYVHQDELNGVDIGLLQEDLNGGYSVIRRIKELPMYHIREKVELHQDVLHLFNGEYAGRPLNTGNMSDISEQRISFSTLDHLDTGRNDSRRGRNVPIAASELDIVPGIPAHEMIEITQEQETLIEKRKQARRNKDWGTADDIRTALKAQGIIIEDAGDAGIIVKKQ